MDDDSSVVSPLIGEAEVGHDPYLTNSNLRYPFQVYKELILARPTRFLLTLGLALSPAVIMLVCSLTKLHSFLVAMFVMHILSMLLIPIVIIRYDESKKWYREYFLEALRQANLLVAVLSFCIVTALGSVGYALLRCGTRYDGGSLPVCIPNFLRQLASYGFDMSMPVLIVLGIYFALVNPLLEEFFWRVFLHRELGQSFFPQSVPDEEAEDFLDLENNTDKSANTSKYPSISEFPGHLLISAFYASYHFIIIRQLLNSYALAAIALCGLILFGRLLAYYCGQPQKLGFISACSLHSGLDFVVDFAVLWQVLETASASPISTALL